MSYASNTSVTVERSQNEMKRLLVQYGADEIVIGERRDGSAMIAFMLKGFPVRFTIPAVDRSDIRIKCTPTGKTRTPQQIDIEVEKEMRRMWRARVLLVKAKLVACDEAATTIFREFMPDLQLPNGTTVEERYEGDVTKVIQNSGITFLPDLSGGNA